MAKKIFLFVLLIVGMFLLVSCDNSTYTEAKNAYDSGNYEMAISLFEELEDYQDSKEMLKKSLDAYFRQKHEWKDVTIYLEKYSPLVNESEYKELFCEEIETYV